MLYYIIAYEGGVFVNGLGERVKSLRTQGGITQAELAENIFVSAPVQNQSKFLEMVLFFIVIFAISNILLLSRSPTECIRFPYMVSIEEMNWYLKSCRQMMISLFSTFVSETDMILPDMYFPKQQRQ